KLSCGSNLHQIDIAMHMYINENKQTYPCASDPIAKKLPTDPNVWLWMGRGWRSFIMPYFGENIDINNPSVLKCPGDQTAAQTYEATSYSYSMAFYHSPQQIDKMAYFEKHDEQWDSNKSKPSVPQEADRVASPAGKIIIGDWSSNHLRTVEDAKWWRRGWWIWEGKRNYLFADGHIRLIDANDIKPARDGNPNPNVTIHGIEGIDWPQ
ncbi:MAG: DUF1559 domain-containing protein, partial [Alphaproteobacteria bacterium]